MRLVPSFFSDNWHKQIEAIASSHSPLAIDHGLNPDFPFGELFNYTKQYLAAKKERAAPGVSDERLMKLIQRSDNKEIAFATCMNILSPQAIRTLVIKDFTHLETKSYLRLLILAYHGNPAAIDEEEHARAKATLTAVEADEPDLFKNSRLLKALFDITCITPVPKNSLVYTTIQTTFINACPRLASILAHGVIQQDWHRCYSITSWMINVIEEAEAIPADHLNLIGLLDTELVGWRKWVAWRPLHSKSHPPVITLTGQTPLRQFLELEGPDVLNPPKANAFERLSEQVYPLSMARYQIGNFQLETSQDSVEEARDMLDRIRKCTSYAVATDNSNIVLLTTLCYDQVITTDTLDVLETVEAMADQELTTPVLNLCRFRDTPVENLHHAKLLVSKFNDQHLSAAKDSAIGKIVVDVFSKETQVLQLAVRMAWNNNDIPTACSLELKLQAQVEILQTTPADPSWLSKFASAAFVDLVKYWPTYQDVITLQKMRDEVRELRGSSAKLILGDINKYFVDLLCERGSIEEERRTILRSLVSFWRKETGEKCNQLAVLLASGNGKFRRDCISQLHLLADDEVEELLKVMKNWAVHESSQDKACEDLARFLAYRAWAASDSSEARIVAAWKPVLYRMLKARGTSLVHKSLKDMTVEQYVNFLGHIQLTFGNKVVWNEKLSPPIMEPSLHQWADRLGVHLPVLKRLEEHQRSQEAIRCFLVGDNAWLLEGILCHLGFEDCWVGKTALYDASYGICCLMSREADNAQDIYDVLCSIFQMSLGGAAACRRLVDLHWEGKAELSSVFLMNWLKDSSWSENDRIGFQDTARLLKIKIGETTGVSSATLGALIDYIDTRYTELLVEAKRLDYMRVGLKTRDCDGVAALMDEHKIEDATAMEDAFARLPIELLNVVETISDSEAEILFPLNDLTILQRAALGIGNAQNLLVRLYIGDYGDQPKFCIHLDNEPKLDSRDVHAQWAVHRTTREPESPICYGSVTPVTYQLARMLSRYLIGGFKDLLSIHTLVATSLKTMGAACIICGTHHGASLRKATICDAWECLNIFSRAPLEIRLADIRQDPMAVDMLITMIQSAITSGYHNLLPNCPFDKDTCLKIMKTLPSMQALSKSKHFSATIRKGNAGKTEQFLTWVCCSFRGFLSTATGSLRIPSLPPGTLQFVLANAAPVKELTFASEFSANTQQSRVVFHGTSLDRLYLILHQGLKNMSGTPLQAYGAASGPGIYLADEPSTSWAYADRKAAGKVNWPGSAIKIGRVLLGCELTSPNAAAGSNGVHVIQKEGSVMVRYIFVIPTATVTMPISGHVSPAMMSVFNSLRSGAL